MLYLLLTKKAPLRRLAEGYSSFLSMSFLPFPASSKKIQSGILPNQPPTPVLPGSGLWGASYIIKT
ncbi:hypothetical protein GGS24DRAFT_463810 [Hypoxylon argillaceum]|nr:hypothetical protein GGS24DRAFT_463810 [Hypoxylon argillaceum]KAI1153349.1 hypothetical protein F4825DRAFT_415348 [Nemania diffusa]